MGLFSTEHEFDRWFSERLGAPTPIQRLAWPHIRAGRNALLIAGTGQGKSLAAWRPLAERMAESVAESDAGVVAEVGTRATMASGPRRRLAPGVRALHIAPLKALARDMLVNLAPLLEFTGHLRGAPVGAGLRCGDTPADERRAQLRRPPEVLSTTPESLFVLLGSAGGRRMLRSVEAVVVDEVHALATGRRGAHLALSLARLDALCERPAQRIGLSATAEPAEALAGWLGGPSPVRVVAPGVASDGTPRLVVEQPGPRLGAYAGTALWEAIHDRMAELSGRGGLLVFCQTRAQVERTAAALGERLGADRVGAHHGSLDSACRTDAEHRFRTGNLAVLVGSASLELGLDLGTVERVAQVGSPGGLNSLRQRAGRSRHRPGEQSVLHWFPLTRHQLLEVEAVEDALKQGCMDQLSACPPYRDVLAQQVVAMVAVEGLSDPDAVLACVRQAAPWSALDRDALIEVCRMLDEGSAGLPEAQRTRWLRVDGSRLHAAAGIRRLLLANAGTIPEWFEYNVVDVSRQETVGRLDEEFAFESSPGQIIQLGHRAFRILRVRCGEVDVEPSDDAPAVELPFWFGEGAGRTRAVREALLKRIDLGARRLEARQLLDEARTTLGALPSPRRIVIERFGDPNGDRHVVLHTMAGARINRAWGLALRKRFCRQFNFELQAAATDDGVLISLGVTSEFEIEDIVRFVRASTARKVLTQALLDTPLFLTRFRWAANTALVLPRTDAAGRVPAQQQRSRTENLVARVFPDQLACLENLSGPREVPDHPLVHQALEDCLSDYMDIDGLVELLEAIERGTIEVHTADLDQPSALAEGLIHAPRHSFLDEAAAEERRTRTFEPVPGRSARAPMRGRARPANVPERSVARVTGVSRCNPDLCLDNRCDSLERLLGAAGFLTAQEGERGLGLRGPVPAGGWTRRFAELVRQRRAVALLGEGNPPVLWVRTDRVALVSRAWPDLTVSPWLPDSLWPACVLSPERCAQQLRSRRRRLGLGWPDTGRGVRRALSA